MSLQNIQLSGETLIRLYTLPLVDLDIKAENCPPTTVITQDIRFLGANKKNITILINSNEASFLTEEAFSFLTGILNACKLTMDDVALVNINNMKDCGYTAIFKTTRPIISLLFDVDHNDIGLPLQFPHFQVHKYNNITYLSAPSLKVLENDKPAKAILWANLKTIFQL
ncbi:MAG: hypothetical protein JST63_18940 [Bacteroidetes bacterium]|nr:hypothetical protein [Bacteroidota bacterium]